MEKKTLIQRIWGKSSKVEEPVKQAENRLIKQTVVFEALKAGEHIDMTDAGRFGVCDMHSTIARVRELIERQHLPYVVQSKWKTYNDQGFRCKEYWLEVI